MATVRAVTDATFDTEVLAAEIPVLVEFGAAWCPPCRAMAPVLEAVAADHAGSVAVRTLDVDANPLTQARYGVLSLPTMLLFQNGSPVRQLTGYTARPALLRALDDVVVVRSRL